MRGGKKHALRFGLKIRAGRFADSGGDTVRVARKKIEHVDLVKRVGGLAFTLKQERFSIRTEVTLPAASSLKNQLSCISEEIRLVVRMDSSAEKERG